MGLDQIGCYHKSIGLECTGLTGVVGWNVMA